MQIRHGHRVGYYFLEEVEQSEEVQQRPNYHPKLKNKQHGTWVGHQVSHIPGSNTFLGWESTMVPCCGHHRTCHKINQGELQRHGAEAPPNSSNILVLSQTSCSSSGRINLQYPQPHSPSQYTPQK